jgi:hypothetical protein
MFSGLAQTAKGLTGITGMLDHGSTPCQSRHPAFFMLIGMNQPVARDAGLAWPMG